MSHIHVIGAGLAGLSAALRSAERGVSVTLYEAAPQAGGRCRSFYDERLGCVIDNGGHVLLGANDAAFAYLRDVGGLAAMTEVVPAAFPFLDLANGATWTLRPNAGPLPWWVFARDRRVPGTTARDYLGGLKLWLAGPDDVVSDCIDPRSRIGDTLWTPLTVAVMNAAPEVAAARPLGAMLRETFGRGEAACRPFVASHGLSAALVDPALARLSALGATYRGGWRLVSIEKAAQLATILRFDSGTVELGPDDYAVLTVPPHIAADLLPGLVVPTGATSIVNAHFRLPYRAKLPGGYPLLGLINGTAQWLIAHDDIVSVTVSAADEIVDRSADELQMLLWRDVARALGTPDMPMVPVRLIKEKRATFAATPNNLRRRPDAATAWRNLFLAGDWTNTGLPATIESAIRSGARAAQLVCASLDKPL